jgi:hypothetical protein
MAPLSSSTRLLPLMRSPTLVRKLRLRTASRHALSTAKASAFIMRRTTLRATSCSRKDSSAAACHVRSAAEIARIVKRRTQSSIVALSLAICSTTASQARKPAASLAFIIRRSAWSTLCRSDLAWLSHPRHAARRWRSRVSRTVLMIIPRSWTFDAVCARHATNMIWRTTPLWLEASMKALRRYSAPWALRPRQTRQASFSAIDRWCTEPLLKSKRADLSMR